MLKQELRLKLSQKLSPQQIQLMKLIQLPTQAFEQRVQQELEDNPALDSGKESEDEFEDDFNTEVEERNDQDDFEIDLDDYLSDDDVPDYQLHTNNYSPDDDEKQIPYAAGKSFAEYLATQLRTYRLDDTQKEIARFLVGSVNENGYIRRSLDDIVDDLAFTQNIYTDAESVEQVLKIVQSLDPAGVAARSLEECLLLQLQRKEETPEVKLAKEILTNSFDAFVKKHYEKLLTKFDISKDELRAAIDEISALNPKPGGSYSNNIQNVEHVIPDFTIKLKDGELELTLNSRNAPQMHVSRQYKSMLKGYKASKDKDKTADQKNAVLFIKQKLDAAKWFIDAVQQRQHTLYITMNAIMNYQRDYFLSGDDRDIKPMILKDIAEKIDMDISTVSRVANSKYADTPYGTFLIKDFFSESMTNDQGEEVSTREIKKILELTVEKEDKKKPLTDEKLAQVLKEKGYPIARRTIAKYREQLNIPVARLRKTI